MNAPNESVGYLIRPNRKSFRLDELARYWCCSTAHFYHLFRDGELTAANEQQARSASHASILVTAESYRAFLERRSSSAWHERTREERVKK